MVRFWDQIKERRKLPVGERLDAFDEALWKTFGREVAIMFTDLSGFTKLSNQYGIEEFLCVIQSSHELFDPEIERFGGNALMKKGDSYLILFDKVEMAAECAVAMQNATLEHNKVVEEHRQVHLCLGIGVGRSLVIDDKDVYGAEVNLASKVGEDIAEQGEILLTAKARVKLESSKFKAQIESAGDRDIIGEIYKLNWR